MIIQFCHCTTSNDVGIGSLAIQHWLVFCVEQVGLYLSIIVGSVGVLAQVAGGVAADYMYARTNDLRWYAWVAAITSSIATPFAIACYYATSDATSLALFVLPTLAANCFDAPVRRYTDAHFRHFVENKRITLSHCIALHGTHCDVLRQLWPFRGSF